MKSNFLPRDRRGFLVAAGAALAAGCATSEQTQRSSAPSSGAAQAGACTVYDKTRQATVTPDAAIAMLKEGNERFARGDSIHCDLLAQVRATSTAQAPFAAVLGCIDSRVPPELVFDQRIGDLFVGRIAGNFVNDDMLGSLDFAARLAGAKAIVVLGHGDCGAIKGAIDNAQLGLLTGALGKIRPVLPQVKGVPGEQNSKNKALLQAVTERHALNTAGQIVTRSAVMRELVDAGQLKVVAAVHDMNTGRIRWLS